MISYSINGISKKAQHYIDLKQLALPRCQMAKCMIAAWCCRVFNKVEAFTAWHGRQVKAPDKSTGSEIACSNKNVVFANIWMRPFHPTLLWGRKYQCFTLTYVWEGSSLLIWWREVADWVNPLFEVIFQKLSTCLWTLFSISVKTKIIAKFLKGFLSNKYEILYPKSRAHLEDPIKRSPNNHFPSAPNS